MQVTLDHPLLGLVLGILIGALLTVSLSFPRVGRGLGKLMAVALLGLGGGLLCWGLIGSLSSAAFEPMEFGPVLFSSAAQTLGWGVGCLCGGITALVLAFVGRTTK